MDHTSISTGWYVRMALAHIVVSQNPITDERERLGVNVSLFMRILFISVCNKVEKIE